MRMALEDVLKDWMVEHDPEGVGQLCRDAHNELATLRAQVLPEAVVKAVRAYQRALPDRNVSKSFVIDFIEKRDAMFAAIEADAKEREG